MSPRRAAGGENVPVETAAPRIRRITADDAGALRRVRLAALADAPAAFGQTLAEVEALPLEHWAERAGGESHGDASATFFAERRGEVIGVAGGLRRTAARAHLFGMWVAPEARRRGVGATLVRAVCDWAREQGCEEVELFVADGNDAARLLYESCGFSATAHREQVRWAPDRCKLLMVRRLA